MQCSKSARYGRFLQRNDMLAASCSWPWPFIGFCFFCSAHHPFALPSLQKLYNTRALPSSVPLVLNIFVCTIWPTLACVKQSEQPLCAARQREQRCRDRTQPAPVPALQRAGRGGPSPSSPALPRPHPSASVACGSAQAALPWPHQQRRGEQAPALRPLLALISSAAVR